MRYIFFNIFHNLQDETILKTNYDSSTRLKKKLNTKRFSGARNRKQICLTITKYYHLSQGQIYYFFKSMRRLIVSIM